MRDIVIVGAGPAGLTAAIYAARAGKDAAVFEKENAGGQIVFSPMVDNYPGIPHLSGAKFAEKLLAQAEELGVEVTYAEVTGIREIEGGFEVAFEGGAEEAKAVILSTGVAHRSLNLPGEEELIGAGISFCAVCDGAFYKDADVLVVGGGDTALQDAIFLSATAKKVTIIIRRDEFRAEKSLVTRALANPKIEVLYSKNVDHYIAEDGIFKGLCLKCAKTNELMDVYADGCFLAVGQKPMSDAFKGLVDVDKEGYYYVGEDALTNVPGIFAAGDARIKSVRQLTTAVGDGAAAAVAACEYIDR